MRHIAAAVLLSLTASAAYADDLTFDCSGLLGGGMSCRQAFHEASKDVSAAFNYKILGPAQPTGLLGFGIAAIGTYTPVENKDAWQTLTGDKVDGIGMVGGVITKGLPLGFDVGAFYAAVPQSSGAGVYGVQVRYALVEGGVAEPAVAIEANYTAGSNVDDFDYSSWGADLLLSKGIAFFTPYVGIGYQSASSKPSHELKTNFDLKNEDVDQARFLIGMRMSLFFLDLTPEYERSGDNNVYNLRLGLSF